MTRAIIVNNAMITVAAGLRVSIIGNDDLRDRIKQHITPAAPLMLDEVPVVVDDGTAYNRQLAALVEALKVRDGRRFAIVAREPKQKAQWKRELRNKHK